MPPAASGNVATEDLAFMLQAAGVVTAMLNSEQERYARLVAKADIKVE